MSQSHTPKTRAAKAAAAAKLKQQLDADVENYSTNWEITADAETLKELSSLSRQRDQVSMKLTRVQRALATAKHVISPSQLRTYLKNIDDAYNEFSAVHSKLIAAIPDEAFEERYNHVRTVIDELMVSRETDATRAPLPQPQVIVQQQPLKVPIPTFEGSYANWPKFKAIFQDLMANSGDSDAIKLYHLDKALVGEAAGVLDAKVISEGNYQQAWAILTDRFENKRIIVETHIRGLFNIPKMASGTCKELRRRHDECTRHVESLKYLEQKFLGVSDLFLVHILSSSMDQATRMAWEATQKKGEIPTYAQTISFLQTRCQMLENCEMAFQNPTSQPLPKPSSKGQAPSKAAGVKVHAAATESQKKDKCDFCQGTHRNYQCDAISSLPFEKRIEKVRTSGVCFNCLRKGHSARDCSSPKTCQKCQKRHHTQLHNEELKQEPKPSVSVPAQEKSPPIDQNKVSVSTSTRETPQLSCNYANSTKTVFLLTAVVNVVDRNNRLHPCRALLDSGSQVNFITADLANCLGSERQRVDVPIRGINDVKTIAHDKVEVRFRSRVSDYQAQVQCLITPNVTGVIPSAKIDASSWNIPFGVQLADPEFYKPEKIDMLLGAELFLQLLRPGHIKIDEDFPELRETSLGWVVAGVFRERSIANEVQHSLTASLDDVEEAIQRFWKIEEVPDASPLTSEEQECEAHFLATHRRTEDGRYIVRLPFRENANELNDCRSVALKRFQMLQQRLQKNPKLKQHYIEFMREYEQLGHCREIREENDDPKQQNYYLPHHAVLRPSSSTTKCRVVFDASAKANAASLSLNEVLQVGATVQKELYDVMLRFCKYKIAFTADVPKMYRQIIMDPRDTHFLRVFWCEQPSDRLRVLELTTVTYGTASAPFQATRCLQQLAEDESTDYPIGARIVKEDFYVDDALSSADSLPAAVEAVKQLKGIMQKGGFSLHKWCSNSNELLEHIPTAEQEQPAALEEYEPNGVIKVLGLLWDPKADIFQIARPIQRSLKQPVTKRIIYSEVARLFDPLGLVSSVIVVAKLLVQRLWQCKIGWDDPVNDQTQKFWEDFANSLSALETIAIPRRITFDEAVDYELHGFADASSVAYGACVYVRSLFSNGSAKLKLVTSKSKVAPLHELSTPRKELCAALLLTRLVEKVVHVLHMEFRHVVLWSDSQIVLAWMKRPAHRLKVFVRNRIAEINSKTAEYQWCYIRTTENPADIVSRGLLPNDLCKSSLWWYGPSFLSSVEYEAEDIEDIPENMLPEITTVETVATAVEEEFPLFSRFSDFRKIERVMALSTKQHATLLSPSYDIRTMSQKTMQSKTTNHRRKLLKLRVNRGEYVPYGTSQATTTTTTNSTCIGSLRSTTQQQQ
ncbi:uncharacterized protein LOC134289057 [Aedes albopictus]|uniref:CCHC-type domain-containing protein n=1 Tax=Aedes albopictus TaxID=7160 RepID=A0ABM1XSB3_AEDAL